MVKDATHIFGSLLDHAYVRNSILREFTFSAFIQHIHFSDNDGIRFKVLKNDIDFNVKGLVYKIWSETFVDTRSL